MKYMNGITERTTHTHEGSPTGARGRDRRTSRGRWTNLWQCSLAMHTSVKYYCYDEVHYGMSEAGTA
jgi:hypothetical protein